MAADDAAVVVSLRADLKGYEAALKAAVRATERAAKASEDAFASVGKKGGSGGSNVIAVNFQKGAKQIENDARVMSFQLNDIFSGLASGQGMRAVQQQLGQIAQQLSGGSLRQGAATMGAALMSMVNPINLAVVAFGILATVAASYFSDTEENADKAAQSLRKVADELDKIAKAHPNAPVLQEVAAGADKAAAASENAAAKTKFLAEAYSSADTEIAKAQADIVDFVSTLQSGNDAAQIAGNKLLAAFAALATAIKDRADATDELKALQDALNNSQVQALPAAKAYAAAFAAITEQFKKANDQGQQVITTFDNIAKKAAIPAAEQIGPPMPSHTALTVGKQDMERAAFERKQAEDAAKEAERAAKQASEENKREAERAAKEAADALNKAIVNQTKVAVDAVTGLLGKSETANSAEINAFLKAGGVDLDAATTAWCAAFVNSALAQVGIKGTGSNAATSFMNWGKGVDLSKIQRGDVLVEPRGLSAGQKGGHVGFATGNVKALGDQITQVEMISGNASDKVAKQWVDATDVIARRASDAFQLPADALDNLTEQSKAASEAAKKAAADVAQVNQQFANVIGSGISTFIHDLMSGKNASDAFADAIQGITSQLIDMMIQMLIIKPLMKSLGGDATGGGGILGGILGFEGGGTVGLSGHPAGRRPAALWANAPRFAAGGVVGLKPGEVPIIAHRGEIIVPNARRLASSSGGGRVDNSVHQQNRISIDMSGSGYVAANSENAKQVGQNMQKLIQAELVRESRPGGLLRQVPR